MRYTSPERTVLMNPTIHAGLGVLLLASFALAPTARAQSAKGLLDKMLEVESQRAKGVDDYAMDVTTMGHDTTLFYERVSTKSPNGKPIDDVPPRLVRGDAESPRGGARDATGGLASLFRRAETDRLSAEQ